jgi:hypothetical protein
LIRRARRDPFAGECSTPMFFSPNNMPLHA